MSEILITNTLQPHHIPQHVAELLRSGREPSELQTTSLSCELKSIQSEIRELQHRILILHQRQEQYLSLSAPIRKLPPEILSTIFIFAEPIATFGTKNPASNAIGLVCLQWRRISLSTPQLWTSMFFACEKDTLFSDSMLNCVRTHLERSSAIPLSLTFQVADSMPTLDVISLVNILRGHAPGCRHLTFHSQKQVYADGNWIVLHILDGLGMNASLLHGVESLNIDFGDLVPFMEEQGLTEISSHSNIRHLSLIGRNAPMSYICLPGFPFSQLSTLFIEVGPDAALAILRSCQNNLISAHIMITFTKKSGRSGSQDRESQPHKLKNLRHLSLETRYSDPDEKCRCFLASDILNGITAPSLVSLPLVSPSNHDGSCFTAAVTSFIYRSQINGALLGSFSTSIPW